MPVPRESDPGDVFGAGALLTKASETWDMRAVRRTFARMDPLHRAVARYLHAHGISRATPVLVATSGGADSMALLQMLASLGQKVGVAHIHHGLRDEADADLAFVAERARLLGLPFAHMRVDARRPRAAAGRRLSPEARARDLRYAALERLRSGGGYAHVATAHTLDDQAETLLLRAIRGSDLAGLAGIRDFDGERGIVRPLLAARREALRSYLADRGLVWREDASNAALEIPRNRVRLQVLPELERAHPGAVAQLARLARSAHEWRSAQGPLTRDAGLAACRTAGSGFWIEPQQSAARLSAVERRAVLAQLLSDLGLGEWLSHPRLDRMERFIYGGRGGRRMDLPSGYVLLRDCDRCWLGPVPGPAGPTVLDSLALRPGGRLELHDRGVRLAWTTASDARAASDGRRLLACDEPRLLHVRSPREDDRWAGEHSRSPRRLREVLARERWPQRIRSLAVVIEDAEGIVGVVGFDHEAGIGDASDWRSLAVATTQAGGVWELRAERVSRASPT